MTTPTQLQQLSTKDFYYELPEDKIAFYPLAERDQSKLLIYKNGQIIDEHFKHILNYIDTDTVIVFNESKVINARLKFYKSTGAEIEIFCIKPAELTDNNMHHVLDRQGQVVWQCLVGGKKKWKNKAEPLYINPEEPQGLRAYIHAESGDTTYIRFEWEGRQTFNEWLIEYGHTPLPPYIKRADEAEDKDRYQTVFAHNYGSVAAPTASLHFSEAILKAIQAQGIPQIQLTLHVGAGTFLPMKDEWIHQHTMHEEIMECRLESLQALISAIHQNKKILAIGTTATRTLESLYWLGVKLIKGLDIDWSGIGIHQWEAYELQADDITAEAALSVLLQYLQQQDKTEIVTQTQIFIVPGYRFRIVDILQTNFHQPESTLLMLVSAFLGYDTIMHIYQHALSQDYRFLSYGDCTLLYR